MSVRFRLVTALALLSLVAVGSASGQSTVRAEAAQSTAIGELELAVGRIQTSGLANLLVEQPDAFSPERRYVVQLDSPITPQRRAQLASAGVQLGDYLPQFAYIADLSASSPQQIAQLGFVSWVGEFQQGWKISPEIGTRVYRTAERQLMADQGLIVVDITLFADELADDVLAGVTTLNGVVHYADEIGNQMVVSATLPIGNVQALEGFDDVQFVEEAGEFTVRNSTTRWIVQSNQSNVTPVYDRGIHGEGQIVGIMDGKVRESHCSFDDAVAPGPTHRKILAYNTSLGTDSHGTHVAGTAVGDAGASNDTRGIAYAGKMVFDDIPSFTEAAMYAQLQLHHNQGARLHTNSWGDDGTTSYNSLCRGIDSFSYTFEDSLVLFAVTNLSTLKNPENAKNLLAVGASQDTPSQASHCSGGAGPTADGRRKPEIYAPGCSTNSSNSSTTCSTVGMTGTSMASPAVTGAGALARQYYVDGFYPSGAATPADAMTPSAALVKATLLNSAVDMTGISGFPSNTEGWGRVLLDNALYFAGDQRSLIVRDVRNNVGLSTGGSVDVPFNVTGSTQSLKVTLVWTEPPASASTGTGNPVINNLNLELVNPSAALYRGNVFSGGVSITGGTADAKNNVEQALLNSPPTGAWIARITGAAVSQGTQGYALVITGQVSDTPACPTIESNPDPQSVCNGDTAVFSASASGASLSYAWSKDGGPLTDGGNISGATTPTLTISNVSAADEGDYLCTVTNGCGSRDTSAASLSVLLQEDLDGDGTVGPQDLALLLSNFDGTGLGDLDGNAVVDGQDLALLLAQWEVNCP